MHPPEQDDSGTLASLSFALLLVRALDQRWTGTLFVEAFDSMHLIQLDDGLVSRVLVPDDYARLGELVVEAGVIMETELELALESDELLGRTLAKQRLIDAKTLQRALVLQILKRLVRLFDYPDETEWSFSDDVSAFEEMPEGVRVDTLRVLWAGIGTHGEVKARVDATLARIGPSPFRIREGVKLSRFGFTGDAGRLVELIDSQSTTLDDLVDSDITPEGVCQGIVYLLAITRYLDFTPVGAGNESPAPISSSEGPPTPGADIEDPVTSSESNDPSADQDKPRQRVAKIRLRRMRVPRAAAPDPPGTGEQISRPSSSSQEPPSSEDGGSRSSSGRMRSSDDPTLPSGNSMDHVMAEIKGRLARLEKESPFTLLNITPAAFDGLDEEAVSDMLWLAYERASRRWHPDSCPHDLAELREGMTKLYTAISEAYEVLLIAETRNVALQEAGVQLTSTETPDTEVSSSGEREVGTVRDVPTRSTTDPSMPAVDTTQDAPLRPVDTVHTGAALKATLRSNTMPSPAPPVSEPEPSDKGDTIEMSAPPVPEAEDADLSEATPTVPSGDSEEPPPSGRRTSSGAPPSKGRGGANDPSPSKLHERALVALSEQLYSDALGLCRRAIEAAPENPDYVASAVWIQASMPQPDIKVLTLDLDDLLRVHTEHLSARYYRGVLRRRLGYDSAAKQDFERVLQIEPDHAGARRQLEQMSHSSSERA